MERHSGRSLSRSAYAHVGKGATSLVSGILGVGRFCINGDTEAVTGATGTMDCSLSKTWAIRCSQQGQRAGENKDRRGLYIAWEGCSVVTCPTIRSRCQPPLGHGSAATAGCLPRQTETSLSRRTTSHTIGPLVPLPNGAGIVESVNAAPGSLSRWKPGDCMCVCGDKLAEVGQAGDRRQARQHVDFDQILTLDRDRVTVDRQQAGQHVEFNQILNSDKDRVTFDQILKY